MDSFKSGMITLLIVIGIVYAINPDFMETLKGRPNDSERVRQAFKSRESNLVVELEGRVVALLPTLRDRTTYQRFVLELENGHQVTVTHNLTLSRAVPIGISSELRLKGEYDWSPDGGRVHWTHADPKGQREGGWIIHDGQRYD